jgi:hypothetical protein
MRDPGPIAADLANSYAEHFFGRAKSSPQRVERIIPVAAQFLLRFDYALRRQQEAFGQVFDSRVADLAATYLNELLAQTKASRTQKRQEHVTATLEMLIEAALRYGHGGAAMMFGQDPNPHALEGRIISAKAFFRLSRMEYPEAGRLKEALVNLVLNRYLAVDTALRAQATFEVEMRLLEEGVNEFLKLLDLAAPI